MKQVDRRSFLKTALAGIPAIVPCSALGFGGRIAPGNRIVVASIGVGRQGTGTLRSFLGRSEVQLIAVCDVDRTHRENARDMVNEHYGNRDCMCVNDFRQVTRRDDIDAVVISTPDHWHVLTAMDAASHGKDVYVEKPLSLTIHEGRRLCEVVRAYDRVLQTGSQQRSTHVFYHACELVRNGRIGKLQVAQIRIPGNNVMCEPMWSPQPVPEELDYDMWLGPAPWKPYHEQRCHYSFRFLSDYSGGQVTNWGAHHIDIAQWALDMDSSGPVEVTGSGEFPTTGLFDTATKVDFECTYANGAKLVCRTLSDDGYTAQVTFEGTDGRIFVSRGSISSDPPSIVDEVIRPGEIRLCESTDHVGNFLECVRTRRRAIADVEIGHRSATICHLGNIAMLLGRKLRWDPAGERFVGDESANRLAWRPKRTPWYLG